MDISSMDISSRCRWPLHERSAQHAGRRDARVAAMGESREAQRETGAGESGPGRGLAPIQGRPSARGLAQDQNRIRAATR